MIVKLCRYYGINLYDLRRNLKAGNGLTQTISDGSVFQTLGALTKKNSATEQI